MNPNLQQALLTIYANADHAVQQAGPKCEASGRCCRFAEYGHTLFISQIEADYLLENAPSFSEASSAVCPFQVEGLCTAREPRPLGCRVYFCDPSYQDEGQRISEEGIRNLKALADSHGIAWRYAPLHVFLREYLETHPTPTVESKPHKISLPVIPQGEHQ